MRKIRDVLRYRHSTDLSLEAIARALKISKGVVAKYLRLAQCRRRDLAVARRPRRCRAGETALPASVPPANRPSPNPTTRWFIRN